MIGDYEIRKSIDLIGEEIRRNGYIIETDRVDNITQVLKVSYDGRLYKLTYSNLKHQFIGVDVID